MATRNAVLVHYHEIGLKKGNRAHFERALIDNIKRATADIAALQPKRLPGRILITLPEGADAGAVADRLDKVFGIANHAVAIAGKMDVPEMFEAAEQVMQTPHQTFAVRARTAHSTFPMSAREINEKLGAQLLERFGARVNLDAPERTCHVEIVSDLVLVYAERRQGAGGLPVGTGGRMAVLLSAGIDSPVAAARMMRRGARCSFVHFHSQPFTDRSSARNAEELADILTRYQYDSTLYLVPLAPSQEQIVATAPEELRTILYRRMMMRIAGEIARREGAKALVTGDALGQVASQTIENIAVVGEVSPLPVLRPLIGMDKLEIIDAARALGTFDVSSAPCQEACVLFEPKRPVTKAHPRQLAVAERDLPIADMVAAAVEQTEARHLSFP